MNWDINNISCDSDEALSFHGRPSVSGHKRNFIILFIIQSTSENSSVSQRPIRQTIPFPRKTVDYLQAMSIRKLRTNLRNQIALYRN